MASNFIITYCARCGKEGTIVFERTHIVSDIDDWLQLSDSHNLCPSCAKGFRDFVKSYFEDGQCPSSWREKE